MYKNLMLVSQSLILERVSGYCTCVLVSGSSSRMYCREIIERFESSKKLKYIENSNEGMYSENENPELLFLIMNLLVS